MGLDTTHGCWHGAYGAFMKWRCKIAEVMGLPPLELMEGFYNRNEVIGNPFYMIINYNKGLMECTVSHIKRLCEQFPIRWEILSPNPIYELLYHSDCDGLIEWDKCEAIAIELEKIIPLLPDEDAGGHIGNWREKTKLFIEGLRLASAHKEDVEFH